MPDKPARGYEIAPSVLWTDRVMYYVIKIGGLSIITAVLAIFLFIFWQIWPLFQPAKVVPDASWALPPGDYIAMGADEWSEYPFALTRDGRLLFIRTVENGAIEERPLPLPAGEKISSVFYHPKRQELVLGTDRGTLHVIEIGYSTRFEGDRRTVLAEPRITLSVPLGVPSHPILLGDLDGLGGHRLAAALQRIDGEYRLTAALLTQRRTLVGAGNWTLTRTWDLTRELSSEPLRLMVNERADGLILALSDGTIKYFAREVHDLALRQTFTPFAGDSGTGSIAVVEFLFGDDSVVVADTHGENKIYSLYEQGSAGRRFGLTKQFPSLGAQPSAYAKSLRNKAFLLSGENRASLRFATTERIRWEADLPFEVRLAFLGSKYDSIWLLDASARLHRFTLDDPHPEAGLRAFFGKIWYEGAPEPAFAWQSTGATDDFEPKLSMVPLLLGTIKGTVYAMLFSTPLALLAALYTSQFAHPDIRRLIKPTMEIMASLPSVILGFLAALWLAPLLEQRVPSVLLMLIALPLTACAVGALWNRLPARARRFVRTGYEFLYIAPLLAAVGYVAWQAGPFLESILFVARDPSTGVSIADFRLWWIQTVGLPFEQRNSLVVGFMMGFAVIPIIFTIAEDSLSNVPPAFRSASLALGASRWQTAVKVVLPTASAGIFSALMIGFGRAVGETMIVLMATGNTPIMDFNIFSGMRTLSANIAVELPEAPHNSTLYRALFLGAMLLFLMTFLLNTLAELLRHHLREKFKAI
ncbi:MAG: ABC transporter permease subunit [Kiritimatiellae bacterium]|nr:ABC transporter permease subunit [Kiritimatiellia bacterium]MDW8458496.1 ABC transporter permease subunit [Verrucomicrobiota bacterium]